MTPTPLTLEQRQTYTLIREELIEIRNAVLSQKDFDADGAVLLSHTIAWMHCRIHGKEYKPE
jgi:hypothetical protein